MDIFESLENLNVSEECFEDIVGLVEKYLVTAPEYSKKYIPGKLYTPQARANIQNKSLDAKTQELKDAASRENKSVEDIANRRGYDKGALAPTLKTPDESIKSAKHRKGIES